MTPDQFVYWLSGFFEGNGTDLASIKDHLALVVQKVTPDRTVPQAEVPQKPQKPQKEHPAQLWTRKTGLDQHLDYTMTQSAHGADMVDYKSVNGAVSGTMSQEAFLQEFERKSVGGFKPVSYVRPGAYCAHSTPVC